MFTESKSRQLCECINKPLSRPTAYAPKREPLWKRAVTPQSDCQSTCSQRPDLEWSTPGAMPEKSAATEIREHGAESAFAGLSKVFPIKNRPVPLPKDLINHVGIN